MEKKHRSYEIGLQDGQRTYSSVVESRTFSFSKREANRNIRKCDADNKDEGNASGKKTQLIGKTHSLKKEFASYGPTDVEFASYGHPERAPLASNQYVKSAVVPARPRRSPSVSGSGEVRRIGLSSAYQASAWRRWRREKQAANRRQNERNLSMFAKAASKKEVR